MDSLGKRSLGEKKEDGNRMETSLEREATESPHWKGKRVKDCKHGKCFEGLWMTGKC